MLHTLATPEQKIIILAIKIVMKEKQTRKLWSKAIIALGIVSTALIAFQLDFRKKVIYPIPDLSVYEMGTYHEDIDTNWSEPAFTIKGEQIHFSYKLTSTREEPFAAFYFRNINIDSNLTDTKAFDHLQIFLSAKHAQRIPISLRFRNDSLFRLGKSFPEISVTTVVAYKEPGLYNIPLSQFEIAAWWLRYHGIEKQAIDLGKTTQLKYLSIGSCQALEPGASDEIIIGNLVFFNRNLPLYLQLIAVWVLIGLAYLFLFWFTRKPKEIVIEHIALENENVSAVDKAKQIKQFLGKNYTNSDLTMYHMQRELKMSANEIRQLFKDEIQDTFKNYLKQVRIIEVKRLLLETDLSISEAAYKCGFNDIPHFNRQFKDTVGMTPKQFRSTER